MFRPSHMSGLLVIAVAFVVPLLAIRGQLDYGSLPAPGFHHRHHFPDVPRRSVESYLYQLERRELISQNAFLRSFVRSYRDSILGNGNGEGFDFAGGDFVRSRNYPEWFETPRDELSCKEVPAVVNAGRPPGDVCLAAKGGEKRCVCIKNHGSRFGEYHSVCGNCRDACGLRFTPEGGGFLEELVKLNDTVVDNDVETL